MPALSEIGKRLLWAIVPLPITTIIAYGLRGILERWGGLDPYVASISGILMQVSVGAVLDVIAVIIGAALYILAIWILARMPDRDAVGLRVREWLAPADLMAQLGSGDDIERRLKSGCYVAKGFRLPRTAGDHEIVIRSKEWRILNLDYNSAVAFCETTHGGDQYIGVVIGEKRMSFYTILMLTAAIVAALGATGRLLFDSIT